MIATIIQMTGTISSEMSIFGPEREEDQDRIAEGLSASLSTTELGILVFPVGLIVLILSIIGFVRITKSEMSQQSTSVNADKPRRLS